MNFFPQNLSEADKKHQFRLGVILGVQGLLSIFRVAVKPSSFIECTVEAMLLLGSLLTFQDGILSLYAFVIVMGIIRTLCNIGLEVQVSVLTSKSFLSTQRGVFQLCIWLTFIVVSFASFKFVLQAYRAFKQKRVDNGNVPMQTLAARNPSKEPNQSNFAAFTGQSVRIGV